VVSFAIAVVGGFLKPTGAVAFAAATTVFLIEDALRRLLMARLRFWRIVLVDLVSLAGSLVTLLAAAWSGHTIGLGIMMLSLFVGQLVAIAVAVVLLPPVERWLAPPRPAALGAVAGYGTWRAAQQFLRPGMLTAMRLLVVGVAGLATLGALEAARIYTTPMLLVVTGASSSVACLGFAGPLLTGERIQLDVTAVVGWCAYAVSVAAVTPYGALAAVRRRQAAVLGLRSADSLLALAGVVALLLSGADAAWVPLVLAACSLAGGIAIRQLLLVRHSGVTDESEKVT
jgi:hypothetical protein